eukprot:CAMPEP_0168393938 /NCGR_PEP_ID=MMETSP0228-20121227/19274_1 /TAXON_ID=133427 /ORGANISM="Protoceratium reticulatum, Strain CCCM 535 (=CCMP 1889)" /LENGTH=61 /DNA_ID=CAMNT_0008407331 /DNA_START=39 /DNA_END=221 /DNA_ORIENTATION=+
MAEEPAAKKPKVDAEPPVEDRALMPADAINLNKFLDKDAECCSLHELVNKPVDVLQGLAAL